MSIEQIKQKAAELAAMVQAYSNEHNKSVQIEVKNHGCKELGWICRIEAKEMVRLTYSERLNQ